MQIYFYLFKRVPTLNRKPEVDFRLYDRHLENSMTLSVIRFDEIWHADVKWHD